MTVQAKDTYGTYAQRPAIANSPAASMHTSTDGPVQYISDGTNWCPLINGKPGTQPVAVASWTALANTGVSATDYGGCVRIDSLGTGTGIGGLFRSTAAPSYTCVMSFRITTNLNNTGSSQTGIGWRNSSTGAMVLAHFYRDTTTYNNWAFQIAKWTNATTYSAAYATTTHEGAFLLGGGGWIVMRLRDDNTSRYVDFSCDGGLNFQNLWSVGRTDFTTPDQYGFFVNGLAPGTIVLASNTGN